MGLGVFVHHIGSFCLLVATVLLIIADISAPVVNHLAVFRVDLGSNSLVGDEITFGSFGWCIRGVGDDQCSESKIGYNIAEVINSVDNTHFSTAAENTTRALTHVMVLHAVATGFFFIGFLFSLGTGMLLSLMAVFVTVVGFIMTLVAVVCDFVSFGIIKGDVHDNESSNSTAHYAAGAWCVLVAGILSLIATVLLFITCCAGRRQKRHENRKVEAWNTTPAAPRRRWFWQRRY